MPESKPSVLLRVDGMHVDYGGIKAVKGISLSVAAGELVALIGANGAGKTTTLKAITGLVPFTGSIEYNGEATKGRQSFELARTGLCMVPEGRGVFRRMSIMENLLMGAYARNDKSEIAIDIDRMFAFFPRLKERAQQLAGTMSGGEQQMLVMARALMSRPKLLVLDEPSMGLAPIMVEKVFDVVRDVHAQGVTVLLVEQNAKLALELANRAYVMDTGLVTMNGPASELLHDPRVRAAYLGEAESN
jgi:branched-chain amino acid transport system ATP-binding protein